jgi:hypothetical protein
VHRGNPIPLHVSRARLPGNGNSHTDDRPSLRVHHLLDDGSFAITVPVDGPVQLRIEGDNVDHDVRLRFANPVEDISGLSQAACVLMVARSSTACARVGLKPRSGR